MSRWPDDPSKAVIKPSAKIRRERSRQTPVAGFSRPPPRPDAINGGGRRVNHLGKPTNRPGLYVGETGPKAYGDPNTSPEIEVPMAGSKDKARLVAVRNPAPPPEGTMMQAPHPPPGYRYDLIGKLVPVLQTRIPICEPEAQKLFLDVLEITGSVRAACDACGIMAVSTVEHHMNRDPDFEQRFEAAMQRHRDQLYAAAVQRAVHGYDVPIVGGPYKDEIVAYERKYSDSLLALLLKRHIPEFREAAASSSTKVTINNQPNNVKVGVDISKLDKSQRQQLRGFLADMPEAEARVHVEEQLNAEIAASKAVQESEVDEEQKAEAIDVE